VTALLESARESDFGVHKDTISTGKNTTDKENKK